MMVTVTKKIISRYLPDVSGFQSLMFCSNLFAVCAKGRYQLLNESEQLKHSPSTESVAANKFNNNK